MHLKAWAVFTASSSGRWKVSYKIGTYTVIHIYANDNSFSKYCGS